MDDLILLYINGDNKRYNKFFNAAVFYDFKDIGITCELNQVRKCIINTFYKTIPDSRNRVCLSIFDDIIL